MLKRSLLILPFLSAVPGYSTADGLCDFKGEWRGVMSTSVAGYVPGANVEFTLLADTMSISESGAITGTALSSTTGEPITLSGSVDSSGNFNLDSTGTPHCQVSGHVAMIKNRAEFAGIGTCTEQKDDGSNQLLYNVLSSILTKVEHH